MTNAPKHYETHQYMSLGSNGVDRVCSLRKFLMRIRATNFFINCTSSTRFAPSFVQQRNKYKMHPNTTKHTNSCVQRPMSWIRCVRCEKLSCDFVARTSSLIAPIQPVLLRVSCSNETNPKCTQTVRNKPILEFRVQWGGLGAFVAKNSNVT